MLASDTLPHLPDHSYHLLLTFSIIKKQDHISINTRHIHYNQRDEAFQKSQT